MLLKANEFKYIFGNDYYVAVLVKNKDIFSKRSLTLIRELSNELKDSLSYADKVTSLTDLEFASGTEEGMTIEQIVPEQIPSDGAGLKEIKQKAYSKPYLAKKMVSTDGTMTWIVVKLRPFPADSVWKKTSDMAPDMINAREARRYKCTKLCKKILFFSSFVFTNPLFTTTSPLQTLPLVIVPKASAYRPRAIRA